METWPGGALLPGGFWGSLRSKSYKNLKENYKKNMVKKKDFIMVPRGIDKDPRLQPWMNQDYVNRREEIGRAHV